MSEQSESPASEGSFIPIPTEERSRIIQIMVVGLNNRGNYTCGTGTLPAYRNDRNDRRYFCGKITGTLPVKNPLVPTMVLIVGTFTGKVPVKNPLVPRMVLFPVFLPVKYR
jgi:hypothetical protein